MLIRKMKTICVFTNLGIVKEGNSRMIIVISLEENTFGLVKPCQTHSNLINAQKKRLNKRTDNFIWKDSEML